MGSRAHYAEGVKRERREGRVIQAARSMSTDSDGREENESSDSSSDSEESSDSSSEEDVIKQEVIDLISVSSDEESTVPTCDNFRKNVAAVTPTKDDSAADVSQDSISDDDGDKKPAAKPPPDWIKKGVTILAVAASKGFPSEAKVVSDPYYNAQAWMVNVQWKHSPNWTTPVHCTNCRRVDPSDDPRKGATSYPKRLLKPVKYSEENNKDAVPEFASLTKKKLRVSFSTHNGSAIRKDNRKHSPRVRDVGKFTAAREKTKALLSHFPQAHPPKSVDVALDTVGYPYGVQHVMQEIVKHSRQAQLEDCFRKRQKDKEPFKVTKGMRIEEPFNGDIWPGRVLHDKPKKIRRNGQVVKVWEVEFDDDLSIWDRDESQLRRYRVSRPEIPSVVGRKLNFIELFSGEWRSRVFCSI